MPQFDSVSEFLEYEVVGNTVLQLIIAVSVFVVAFAGLHVVKNIIVSRLQKLSKKTTNKLDDAFVHFFQNIGTSLYFLIALFMALRGVFIPDSLSLIVRLIFLVAIVLQVIRQVENMMMIVLRRHSKDGKSVPAVLTLVLRVVLWAVGVLLILSNLGIDVTSLIAGLGIGGIAVSLALQNILSDLFSSFSIAMDKPFEEGDFIIVGKEKGTVKKIGLKSTRIQSIEGEEIVISNNELTTSRVQNYKKMKKRRILFSVGLVYGTPVSKIEKAIAIIKKLVEDNEQTELDRVHMKTLGDFSLNIEVVYFMITSDYNVYMDTQQELNFGILSEFKKTGIDIAFPTQTVIVEKS